MSTLFYLVIGLFIMHPSTGQMGIVAAKVESPYKTEKECMEAGVKMSKYTLEERGIRSVTVCQEEMPGQPT